MAKYELLQASYVCSDYGAQFGSTGRGHKDLRLSERLYKAGETIEVAASYIPGPHWKPLDEDARKAKEAYLANPPKPANPLEHQQAAAFLQPEGEPAPNFGG